MSLSTYLKALSLEARKQKPFKMCILSQNSAEDLWHSEYFKSGLEYSQPLLQKSTKDKPKQGPV